MSARSAASGNIGTAVGAENDHGQGVSALTRFSYSRRGLALSRDAVAAIERLASGEELAGMAVTRRV